VGKASVNTSVIVIGTVIFLALSYYVGSELFIRFSPTSLFTDALDRIRQHSELAKVLGEPISGHGEASRSRLQRNRRLGYETMKDVLGREHIVMRFFVEGAVDSGVVFLDALMVSFPVTRTSFGLDYRSTDKSCTDILLSIFQPMANQSDALYWKDVRIWRTQVCPLNPQAGRQEHTS